MMENLDNILKDFVAIGDDTKNKILGASFIVTNKDGILYQGAAGRIRMAVDSPPFTAASSGWVASMTKLVTATSLMQIVERGAIQLDDDARLLIPELANAHILRGFDDDDRPILENNINPITLRQLLCHTSGLSYDASDPDIQKWSRLIGRTAGALDQTLEGWNTPLKFRPGESWMYGSGLDWAGVVLEKVTGQSLEEYMSDNIFTPLGMSDTTFRRKQIADKLAGRIVECTYRKPDRTLTPVPLPVSEDPPLDSGGSGLFSTARDYGRFLQALVAAGEGRSALLRKRTADDMFKPRFNDAQAGTLRTLVRDIIPLPVGAQVSPGIGGAIHTADVEGKRRRGTLTWGGMSNSQWWIDRESGIAAVLFANLLPLDDAAVSKLYHELEQAVYRDLLPTLETIS